MTNLDLNIKAFEFVTLIDINPNEEKKQKTTGSSQDHLPFIDISDKLIIGPFIERSLNHDLSMLKMTISIDKIKYGFNNVNYKGFYELIKGIHSIDFFENFVSFSFVEEKSFLWMVDVYTTGKASHDLILHLENEAEKVVEKQTYYFHVINLHIHKPFKIGDVELTYFKKEYFDDWWNDIKNESKVSHEEFDNLYRKYQGRVFASYEATAEPKRGEEIAFKECSLASDVMRCFTTTNFYPARKCYVDLSDRLNANFQSDSISIPKSNRYDFKISTSAKNDPFVITKPLYDDLLKVGLQILSNHLKDNPNNELSKLINQSISLYSYSISTFDLHLRITQLITIFESLLLEQERKYKLEATVKKRIIGLMPIISSSYVKV